MTCETGKAIKDSRAEVVRSQDTLMLSAEEAVRIEGEHVPLDASAMGAGKLCLAPGVVHELARFFVDAGTPPGVLNVLYRDLVGPALARDPRVDFVTFTGSTRVSAEIKAASGLRRAALKLGGTGTTIVHEDAAGSRTVESAAKGPNMPSAT